MFYIIRLFYLQGELLGVLSGPKNQYYINYKYKFSTMAALYRANQDHKFNLWGQPSHLPVFYSQGDPLRHGFSQKIYLYTVVNAM